MSNAFFPGSFDPPTRGHLSLIERASALFPKLYIGVTENQAKTHPALFSVSDRVLLIKEITSHLKNIEVLSFTGLTVDYAKKIGATLLIRGARNSMDYDSEVALAQANRLLGKMETCIIPAEPTTLHISSTLIRQVLAAKGPLETFLPKQVIAAIDRQKS